MKILLYSFPNCPHAEQFKVFLVANKLPFKEVIINSKEKRREIQNENRWSLTDTSFLKIVYSHAIHLITGCQPLTIQQLLEHIRKYNPKIEIPL